MDVIWIVTVYGDTVLLNWYYAPAREWNVDGLNWLWKLGAPFRDPDRIICVLESNEFRGKTGINS